MSADIDVRRMRVLTVSDRVMNTDPIASDVRLNSVLHKRVAPVIGSAVLTNAALYERDVKALWTDHHWKVGVLTPETAGSVDEVLLRERNAGLDRAIEFVQQKALLLKNEALQQIALDLEAIKEKARSPSPFN